MAKQLKPRVGNRRFFYSDYDANNNLLAYYSGVWDQAATYTPNEIVQHLGGVWICTRENVAVPPYTGVLDDWDLIGTTPGRAGMRLDVAAAGTDIGAGFVTPPYDTSAAFEVGAATDTVAGTFTLNYPGLWTMSITMSLIHNEAQAGRQTIVRLFNVTKGTDSGGIVVPIARNQPGTLISASFPLQIASGNLGDLVRVEIGGGDAITGITYQSNSVTLVQASPI
jgi:hypothetical protein